MPNQRAVDLIAERLPAGLVHPGDPQNNIPGRLIPLPGLSSLGMPPEQAAAFAKEAGLPSNDAPKLIAEAIVHLLETDGGIELVDKAHLQQLQAEVATPADASPAHPDVELLCQHTRGVLYQVSALRHQVLVDCDAFKTRIDELHKDR